MIHHWGDSLIAFKEKTVKVFVLLLFELMFPKISFKEINSLYSTQERSRFDELLTMFEAKYGTKPEFIARAPGRVNIIGEHIDYEGYGVLPAAIEKDCLIAVKPNQTTQISISHVNTKMYPSQSIPADPQTKFQFINNYIKYFRAGYRAGVKEIKTELRGMQVMISGNIPPAAGLSSSSALCVCSALASLHANLGDQQPEQEGRKEAFIESVIIGQRQTGTASGGMDQSISVLGQANSCLYIQFNPIRCEAIKLPEGSRFVIMNSLVESAKLQTAVFRYNKRVCQCRLAVALLGQKLGLPDSPKILKQLQLLSGLPLNYLGNLVETFLDRHDYTQEELEGVFGRTLAQLLGDIPLHLEVLQANKTFKLWQAAKHVFQQAQRVIAFTKVCNSQLSDVNKQVLLGKLMNQSQQSCKQLYECSCPEIDEITSLAIKKGALGSRLTGAGWGGCTVSLVEQSKCNDFIKGMIADYYEKKIELKSKIQEFGIQNVVFESRPSEGACLIIDI